MNNADYEDDIIVCFVMNTENRMEKYHLKCNKQNGKYILKKNDLSFIKHHTSIMLKTPSKYLLKEIINSKSIELYEIASESLQREIKNCIDFNYLYDDWAKLIKVSFK